MTSYSSTEQTAHLSAGSTPPSRPRPCRRLPKFLQWSTERPPALSLFWVAKPVARAVAAQSTGPWHSLGGELLGLSTWSASPSIGVNRSAVRPAFSTALLRDSAAAATVSDVDIATSGGTDPWVIAVVTAALDRPEGPASNELTVP